MGVFKRGFAGGLETGIYTVCIPVETGGLDGGDELQSTVPNFITDCRHFHNDSRLLAR